MQHINCLLFYYSELWSRKVHSKDLCIIDGLLLTSSVILYFSTLFLFNIVTSQAFRETSSQGCPATFRIIIPTSILMEKIFWYTNSFHIPFIACHVILCQFSFHTQVSYNNISLMETNGTPIHSSDSNISLLYFKAKIYPIISVYNYCNLLNCLLHLQKMRPFDLLIIVCLD